MFSLVFSESPLHLGLVVSSLAKDGVSLFTSNKELMGMSLSIVTDTGTTVDLAIFV